MKFERLNPYSLLVTDPLWALSERRVFLENLWAERRVEPIYVIKREDDFYLIFNGNKRSIIARENFSYIDSRIIENDSDLFTAQERDPRLLPKEVPFDFRNVSSHLLNRANSFMQTNNRYSPVPISEGIRIAKEYSNLRV